jgi:integrase
VKTGSIPVPASSFPGNRRQILRKFNKINLSRCGWSQAVSLRLTPVGIALWYFRDTLYQQPGDSQPMPLQDLEIKRLKPDAKPRKYSDGGGLYLLVQPGGSKLWRMNYRHGGKQKTLAFGPYPATKLTDARALRDKAKALLAEGRDPGDAGAMEAPKADTFAAIAKEWLRAQSALWSLKHSARIESRFQRDVYPAIGHLAPEEIGAPQILALLRKIEDRGAQEIAARTRNSIGAVMRYAVVTGRASRDPAADLRGALKPSPRVKHMARIKEGELREFMQRLAAYEGERQTALAIEFVMHTMVRTNELRFAKWSEINGDTWRIPGDRMKMGRDHIVPLTRRSHFLLKELKTIAGDSEWIVPGAKGKPISENTMLYGLYRMGYHGRATTHGMRGLASTVLNESGLWNPDAIERQLAHAPMNKIRAAYNAAQYLPERIRMLDWWSDYLENASKSPFDLGDLLT